MDKKPLTEEQKEKRRKAVSKYYHTIRKHKKITEEQRIERNNKAKSKYHDKYKYQRKILYLCRQLRINRDEYMKDYVLIGEDRVLIKVKKCMKCKKYRFVSEFSKNRNKCNKC